MPIEERNDALKIGNKVAVQRYEFAIECLGKEKKKVVDLGCGMGYGSHLLKQARHEVVGADNSQEAIDYACINYPGDYSIINIDKSDLSYENFDIVVCLETLCHLKNPQRFIDNIKAKELIISAPIDPDQNDGYKYRLHNLSEEKFKEMLSEWEIIDEFRQKNYLVIYAKKI